eukprot:NODE_18_length_47517_cov_0.674814.p9 type:complete len:483 gc:universal NODE_18_length_47517_cov_0.674814:35269-33821(-)
MSNYSSIFPEIHLTVDEFQIPKVVGNFSGFEGTREITEPDTTPITRRFSTTGEEVKEVVPELKTGLPLPSEIMPAFMSVRTNFEPKPFTGKYENVRNKIFQITNEQIKRKLDTRKTSFTDAVDLDDSDFHQYIKKNIALKFGESGTFKMFMFFVVVVNMITLALETDPNYANSRFLDVIDTIIQGIFIFEVAFKWFYGFKAYWKAPWNWFDFLLATTPVLGSSLHFLSAGKSIKLIRVFKVLRSLRSVQSFDRLLLIMKSIIRSIPEIANILLLLGIIMIVFAIVAVDVLNTDDFSSFDVAMFSLFRVTTQDGWVKLVQKCKDIGQRTEAYLFFTLFEILGVFVLVNLVIATIVNNTQETFDQIKRKKQQASKKLGEKLNPKTAVFHDKNVILENPKHYDHVRVPFLTLDIRNFDGKKIDNLCLLIGIMEQLYCNIEKKSARLNEIFDQIKHNELKSKDILVASDPDMEDVDALTSLLKSQQ